MQFPKLISAQKQAVFNILAQGWNQIQILEQDSGISQVIKWHTECKIFW